MALSLTLSSISAQNWCCCNPGTPVACVQNFLFPGNDCDFWCGTVVGTGNAGDAAGYSDAACTGSVCAAAPVEMTYFDARALRSVGIELSWRTESELNNEGFEIQRASASALDWEVIGFVNGQGTTFVPQEYQFVDEDPLDGINYYRMRQIDFNGDFTYSDVEAIDHGGETPVAVWPTWAKDFLFVKVVDDLELPDIYQVEIFDMVGKKVLHHNHESSVIEISSLPAGQYIASVFFKNKFHSIRFVKGE